MTSNGDNREGAQERTVVMEVSQVELREEIIRVQGRMDVLDTKMDGFVDRMDQFDKRMDSFEQRMDRLEDNQKLMMQMIQQQNERIDKLFYTVIGTGAVIIVTMLGIAFAT